MWPVIGGSAYVLGRAPVPVTRSRPEVLGVVKGSTEEVLWGFRFDTRVLLLPCFSGKRCGEFARAEGGGARCCDGRLYAIVFRFKRNL